MKIRELLTYFGVRTDTPAVKAFGKQVDVAKAKMAAAKQSAANFASGIKSLVLQYLGFQAAVRLGGGLLGANVEVERLNAALQTTEGSAAGAEAAFKRIQKFTAETPFQLAQVTDGYMKLKNLGMDPSERAMTSYGNTASSMGKDLNQMVEAVADASTGEFERLKEFGIKASSQGNKVAFTFGGVTTTVGKNSKEIQDYLIGLGETKFAGAMERQMGTLGGVISNLKDNLFMAAVAIGKGGMNDALRELLRELVGISGAGGNVAKTVGQVLGQQIRRVTQLIRWMKTHVEVLTKVLKLMVLALAVQKYFQFASAISKAITLVRSFGHVAMLAQAKLLIIPAIIGLIILLIQDIYVYLKGGRSLTGRFIDKFKEAPGPIGAIARAILGIVPFLKKVFAVASSIIARLAPIAKRLVARVLPVLKNIFMMVLKIWQDQIAMWLDIIEELWPVVEDLLDTLIDAFQEILPAIKDLFTTVFDVVRELVPVFKDLFRAVIGLVMEVVPIVIDIVKIVISTVIDVVRSLLPLVRTLFKVLLPIIVDRIKSVIRITAWLVKTAIKILRPVIRFIVAYIKIVIAVVTKVVEWIAGAIGWLRDNVWDPVTAKITEWWTAFEGFLTPIIDKIRGIFEGLGTAIIGIWDGVKAAVEKILNWMGEKLGGVVDSVGGAVDKVTSFLGIGDTTHPMASAVKMAQDMTAKYSVATASAGGGQNLTVGTVAVTVQGTTNMGPTELANATKKGTTDALVGPRRQTARAMGGTNG